MQKSMYLERNFLPSNSFKIKFIADIFAMKSIVGNFSIKELAVNLTI